MYKRQAQAEMKQLSVDKGAFDMGAFQEWDDVARKWPEARIVRFFLLMAIKHAQDAAKAKWKGRGVALGNNERNTFGERVVEDLMNVVPSSLDSVRLGVGYECLMRAGVTLSLDVPGAYLLART